MRDLKGKPQYIEGYRYGYGAVDYREGTVVMDTTITGLKPQKLAPEITDALNQALDRGYQWAAMRVKECRLFKSDKEFEACLKRVELL